MPLRGEFCLCPILEIPDIPYASLGTFICIEERERTLIMLVQHELCLRVHYHEVDGQGRVHHSQYLTYFERGRVEMLRASGFSYRELEASGLMLVVRSLEIQFHWPAVFDDELLLTTRLGYCHGARIQHRYRLVRPSGLAQEPELLVTGTSEIGCIDPSGRVRRLPSFLQMNLRDG
jgi:acyl-CoA thioester hydrolase